MKNTKIFACVCALGFAGLGMLDGASVGVAQSATSSVGQGPNDAQIQADVTKALDSKRFKDVKSSVQNSVVTLTGTVELYSAKMDADDRAHHRKNVKGVENLIEVAGGRGIAVQGRGAAIIDNEIGGAEIGIFLNEADNFLARRRDAGNQRDRGAFFRLKFYGATN